MTTRTATAAWLAIASLAAFTAFLVVGVLVSQAPPGSIDLGAAASFYGHATTIAASVTRAGTFPFYLGLCLIALAFGVLRRQWLVRAVLAVATLATAWQASDAFKAFFHRARPPQMLVFQETSASYPSGHAVLVTAFWGTWVAFVLLFPAAQKGGRIAFAAAAIVWMLAIGWSRLALGAHYLSDVVGGYALGTAFALLAAAIATRLQSN